MNLCVCDDLITEITTQLFGGSQINWAAQQTGQFHFHPGKFKKPRPLSNLKFNQHIHVTVRAKSVRQHRAEKRQFVNMIFFTKLNQLIGWDIDFQPIFHIRCPSPKRRGIGAGLG